MMTDHVTVSAELPDTFAALTAPSAQTAQQPDRAAATSVLSHRRTEPVPNGSASVLRPDSSPAPVGPAPPAGQPEDGHRPSAPGPHLDAAAAARLAEQSAIAAALARVRKAAKKDKEKRKKHKDRDKGGRKKDRKAKKAKSKEHAAADDRVPVTQPAGTRRDRDSSDTDSDASD